MSVVAVAVAGCEEKIDGVYARADGALSITEPVSKVCVCVLCVYVCVLCSASCCFSRQSSTSMCWFFQERRNAAECVVAAPDEFIQRRS